MDGVICESENGPRVERMEARSELGMVLAAQTRR